MPTRIRGDHCGQRSGDDRGRVRDTARPIGRPCREVAGEGDPHHCGAVLPQGVRCNSPGGGSQAAKVGGRKRRRSRCPLSEGQREPPHRQRNGKRGGRRSGPERRDQDLDGVEAVALIGRAPDHELCITARHCVERRGPQCSPRWVLAHGGVVDRDVPPDRPPVLGGRELDVLVEKHGGGRTDLPRRYDVGQRVDVIGAVTARGEEEHAKERNHDEQEEQHHTRPIEALPQSCLPTRSSNHHTLQSATL